MASARTGITIVIPTLNEELFLPRLLHDLAVQSSPPPFEVIVVDASTSSRTHDVAVSWTDRLSISCIPASRAHPGAQRNIGATHGEHDLLLFLDADVRIPPEALHSCIREAPACEFVAAVKHASPSLRRGLRVIMGLVDLLMLAASRVRRGATNGDFILTDRPTFWRAGGFNEECLLGEDTDFGLRAQRRGAEYIYIRSIVVIPDGRRAELTPAVLVALEWIRSYLSVLLFRRPPKRAWFIEYPFGVWGMDASK